MVRHKLAMAAAAALVCSGLALTSSSAIVHHNSLKEQLKGTTWAAVAVDNVLADGSKVQSYGPNPSGVLMLDAEGRFSLVLIRSDLPKFASNNRDMGTPEENKAVIQGTLANFGTYAVNDADRTLVLRIENSSFPNWKGTEQKRMIAHFSQDELKWQNLAASNGGTAQLIWKRMK
jgi:hypothetical protein